MRVAMSLRKTQRKILKLKRGYTVDPAFLSKRGLARAKIVPQRGSSVSSQFRQTSARHSHRVNVCLSVGLSVFLSVCFVYFSHMLCLLIVNVETISWSTTKHMPGPVAESVTCPIANPGA